MMQTITIDLRMIDSSGIGTYLRELVPRIISGLPEKSFFLLGSPKQIQRYGWTSQRNISLIPFEAPIYSLKEQFGFLKKIPRQTDLFWSPHYNIPIFFRGKLLVTIHDVFHLALPQFVSGVHRRFYARQMFRILKNRADAIISVSHFTAAELQRLARIPKEKIHVIYHGVRSDLQDAPSNLLPHPKPYLLFVGNVKPHKNLSTLIQAFQRIEGQIPHDLVLVGKREGFITGDSQTLLKAQGSQRIHFTGYVDEKKLGQYFAHCTALVFPSLYEGFGFPPLEAMAYGVPVIVSDRASLPEICGKGALYFNPQNPQELAAKMIQLIQNKSLYQELREEGIIHAGKFSWKDCAQKTTILIQELLEES